MAVIRAVISWGGGQLEQISRERAFSCSTWLRFVVNPPTIRRALTISSPSGVQAVTSISEVMVNLLHPVGVENAGNGIFHPSYFTAC